jgi:hypothetical protein
VLAAAGLYFCWFLLFTPDYGMRSGLGSDQVLAVARIFIAMFLRSDDSLLDACISDLSSIEKGPRWVICPVSRLGLSRWRGGLSFVV